MSDFSKIGRALLDAVEDTLSGMGENVQKEWINTARQMLTSTESQYYVQSIQAAAPDKKRAVITLQDERAVRVETGRRSYDLRSVMLKGRSFRDIPLRVSYNKIKSLSGPKAKFAARMKPSVITSGGGLTYGTRLRGTPKGKLDGLIRIKGGKSAIAGTKFESNYILFRRMSWNGKPWIVRAKAPENVSDRVVLKIPRVVNEAFDRGV